MCPPVALALLMALTACGHAPVRRAPARIPASWSLAAEVVTAEHGMVVSADRYASEAGRDVLAAGGNAVDAAVATAFALAVTHPRAGNIGGGGFMLVRLADGTAAALDFRETAPAAARRETYLELADSDPHASLRGNLAWGVPGSVAGLWEAHARFGSRPWAELLAPAIALARDGIEVSDALRADIRAMFDRVNALVERDPDTWTRHRSWAAHFWAALDPGRERWVQPDLARTLERLADHGPDDFYRGKTAELILAEVAFGGGLLTAADLDGYRAVWREPLRFTYRGHTVLGMPPVSSGGATMAQMANVLSAWDLGALGFGSADSVHLLAETARRAYADRNALLGDPAFVELPLAELSSPAYASRRRADIDLARATPSSEVGPGAGPGPRGDDTTHFSVVDGMGNAVSLTTTINTSFGSHVVIGHAGFLMNNEMDDFATRPGQPNTYGLVQGEANAVAGGKRMLSSMSPSIVLDPEGELLLVTGTPGGSRIINVTWQSIVNAVDHGFDVGQVVSAPRVHHQHLPDLLYFEHDGLDPDVVAELSARGHELRAREPMCDVQAVMILPDGRRAGAADPRGPGVAAGH